MDGLLPLLSAVASGSCFPPGQEPASGADHTFSQKMPTSEHAGQKHQEPVPPEMGQAGSVNVEAGCSLVWESRPPPQAAVCAVSCGTNSLFSSYMRS